MGGKGRTKRGRTKKGRKKEHGEEGRVERIREKGGEGMPPFFGQVYDPGRNDTRVQLENMATYRA